MRSGAVFQRMEFDRTIRCQAMTMSPQSIDCSPAPRRMFLVTAMLVAIAMPAGPAGAQSFDCRAARYPDELTICRESDLARLAQQLATLYHRQMAHLAH